jgi:hypothetical protein
MVKLSALIATFLLLVGCGGRGVPDRVAPRPEKPKVTPPFMPPAPPSFPKMPPAKKLTK